MIAEGSFAPGSRLSDKTVAATLGLTRTPVREAIQRLVHVGLMEVHANRYSLVVDITAERSRATREFAASQGEDMLRSAVLGLSDRDLGTACGLIDEAILFDPSGHGTVGAHVDLFDFLTARALTELHRLLLKDFWYVVFRDLHLSTPPADTRDSLRELRAALSCRSGSSAAHALHHMLAPTVRNHTGGARA